MKFFELQIEFMIPLWRRVALVLVCLVWSAVEFLNGSPGWGVLFVSLGVYALWQLFLDGWPASELSAASDREKDPSDVKASSDESST